MAVLKRKEYLGVLYKSWTILKIINLSSSKLTRKLQKELTFGLKLAVLKLYLQLTISPNLTFVSQSCNYDLAPSKKKVYTSISWNTCNILGKILSQL